MGKNKINDRFRQFGPLACKVDLDGRGAVLMPGATTAAGLNPAITAELKESSSHISFDLHGDDLYAAVDYQAVRLAYILMRRLAEGRTKKDLFDVVSDLSAAVALEKKSSGSAKVVAGQSIPEVTSRHALNRLFVEVIKKGLVRLTSGMHMLRMRLDQVVIEAINKTEFDEDRGGVFLFGLGTDKAHGAVAYGTGEPGPDDLALLRREKLGLAPLYVALFDATANPMFKVVRRGE